MLNVGKHIRASVIPAVNELVSALGRIASSLSSVAQAAGIEIKIPQPRATPALTTPGGADLSFASFGTGGILTQPIFAQVAESGPEAIIPLTDPSRGVPLLTKAAGMLGMNVVPEPTAAKPQLGSGPAGNGDGDIASRYLSQMSRGQAADKSGTPERATAEKAEKAIQVKNDVKMKVEAVTTPVYLDGRMLGEFITQFFAHEALREGALS